MAYDKSPDTQQHGDIPQKTQFENYIVKPKNSDRTSHYNQGTKSPQQTPAVSTITEYSPKIQLKALDRNIS